MRYERDKMTHILGIGYGCCHDWRGDTPQDNSKRTFYTCLRCGESFCHHYDREPDIHSAMENAPQVSEHCRELQL